MDPKYFHIWLNDNPLRITLLHPNTTIGEIKTYAKKLINSITNPLDSYKIDVHYDGNNYFSVSFEPQSIDDIPLSSKWNNFTEPMIVITDPDYISNLSKDVLFNIAINLDLEDLLNLCKTSKHINDLICRDTLWLYKIKKYFPTLDIHIMKPYRSDRSWKQYYIEDLYPTLKKKPNKVLIDSSGSGRLDKVIGALDLGANIHALDDFPVGRASQYGHIEVVKLLIDYGANIHAENNYAFRIASYFGHVEVVKLLIDYGADIQAVDNDALKSACEQGHYNVAKLLIDHGCYIEGNDNFTFRLACEKGHYDVVKLLIEHGSDIQIDNNYAVRLAIRLACERGHCDVVKLLIERGADIQAADNYAVRLASYYGHLDMVKLLIDYGADIYAKNNYAVNRANKYGHYDVVDYLVSIGAPDPRKERKRNNRRRKHS